MGRLSQEDFARLAGALVGVALGAAAALALACLVFPPPDAAYDAARHGTLDWARAWGRHEEREKGFFLFTLLFGGVFGYVGASRSIAGRRLTLPGVLLAAAIVPGASLAIGAGMVAGSGVAAAYAALMAAVLFVATWLMRWLAGDGGPDASAVVGDATRPVDRRPALAMLAASLCIVVTAIFVLPLGARLVAAVIGFDMHMASFMVGPATYAFGARLLPGIDYFTQYSIGTPWLFSFFLAPTAGETMVNAVWFIVAEMLFFQLTLLFFLRWFLRSWGWALVIGLACLMLQFTTPSPLYAPSSTAARYPLLILSVALFVHWIRRDLAWSAAFLLALSLSASLFLNSETGIYTSVAAAIGCILVRPDFLNAAARTVVLGVLTFALFALWNLAAFGPGVLQLEYWWLLLEPLMLYSSGLGAWPIEWMGGYHWLYNVISPGIALASIGWVAATARRSPLPCPRDQLAGLVMMAIVGLLLTTKFINMSVVALWQVNAIGLTIVMAWWLRAVLDCLPRRRPASIMVPIGRRALRVPFGVRRAEATFACAIALVAFLATISDPRNPSLYAIESYRTHPTLVNWLLGGPASFACPAERIGCSEKPVSPQDVALIQNLSRPSDRVALLMVEDWPLLIEARRASKFLFLPSAMVFTQRQLTESLRDIDLIILPREPADKLGITNPDLASILIPMLKERFRLAGETPTLLAWRRRDGSG
jgi:hypothetical protein